MEIKVLKIENAILEAVGFLLNAAASGFTYQESLNIEEVPVADGPSLTVALYAALIKMCETNNTSREWMMAVVDSVLRNMHDDLNGVEGPKRQSCHGSNDL